MILSMFRNGQTCRIVDLYMILSMLHNCQCSDVMRCKAERHEPFEPQFEPAWGGGGRTISTSSRVISQRFARHVCLVILSKKKKCMPCYCTLATWQHTYERYRIHPSYLIHSIFLVGDEWKLNLLSNCSNHKIPWSETMNFWKNELKYILKWRGIGGEFWWFCYSKGYQSISFILSTQISLMNHSNYFDY
jgi:hypothetical protein